MQQPIFNKIQNHYLSKRPFVVYRKPNSSQVKAVFQNNTETYKVTNYDEKGFVFAPFNSDEETIIIPFDDILEEEYIPIKNELNSISESNIESSSHINLVKLGIKAIHNGNFDKVVLSRFEEQNVSKNPIELFRNLLNIYDSAFVYLWFHPEVGCWLGATPEVLISSKQNQFSTMALAGTQLYSDSVTWQKKEKQEQQFVTDFILEELKPVANNITTSEPYTVQAGKLAHIRTDIKGTFNSNLKEIIQNLHPTPAVCGLPKDKAKEFILNNEDYNREFYTGFLGELNLNDESHLFVNLRCMKYLNNKVNIYVGGGITKDSNSEKEFQETVNKASTIKMVLGDL